MMKEKINSLRVIAIYLIWINLRYSILSEACTFRAQNGLETESEGVRFIRVREDLPIGNGILRLRAYPRSAIILRGMERSSDHKYFKINEVNSTNVEIVLNKSLDDLVDREHPQNLLKFRIVCSGGTVRNEEQTAFMSVTVYIEDINDHAPVFQNEPYIVHVDELTPVGTTFYQGIQALDRDKPNTPNSDVYYTLEQPSESLGEPYFALESPHRPYVVLKRLLDFDEGIREFHMPIVASDRGTPSRYANTTLKVIVRDNDDLPPKFTEGVYRTKINEFFPMTGKTVRIPLYFSPPIMAFDQDSLNMSILYDMISGNERKLFRVNPTNGIIFLEKEIDLEEESLPGNTFVLQLEARQKNSPLKRALARVEVEVMDLNDNAPEFEVDLYNISIVENLPSGFSVLQVNAMDRDQGENAEFIYSLHEESPKGAFLIDARTGWLTVRDQALLDREVRSSINMVVKAVERIPPYDDRPQESGTVHVEITLLDSNDNTPQFDSGNLYEFKVSVDATTGTVVGKVTASDPDEGRNGMILYELQRPKGSGYIPFRLDSQTGTLTVSGQLRKGRVALFVEATDQPTNPSERRFSLAVVTIEINSLIKADDVDFMGSPYEFWVGSDVPIGTSVGQVRTTLDYEEERDVMYDLLHSYPEGVPFAIEERSGVITVIRDLEEFNRNIYYFEAVANYKILNMHQGQVVRQNSRTQKKIIKNGDVIEIDEGIVSNTGNVLVTNVTVHVVGSNDEAGILLKGTNQDPIEFHIKENLPGALIGRLLYKNATKFKDSNNVKDLIGQASRFDPIRQHRHMNSKYNRNSTNFFNSTLSKHNRRTRDVNDSQDATYSVYLAQPLFYSDSAPYHSSHVRTVVPYSTRRTSTWRPKNVKEERPRKKIDYKNLSIPTTSLSDEIDDDVVKNTTSRSVLRTPRNITSISNRVKFGKALNTDSREMKGETAKKITKNENPMGLRFLIANQQDVVNKITINDDGSIMTLAGLDREVRDVYRLTIIAEYSKGFLSGAGLYQVNVFVDDVNDNSPTFDSPAYSGIVYENSKIGTEILLNRPIKVTDIDAGRNAVFTLSLSGEGSHLFAVDFVNTSSSPNNKIISSTPLSLPSTNERIAFERGFMALELLLLNPNRTSNNGPHHRIRFIGTESLDRERSNFYHLKLHARDTGGLTSSSELNILIADVNDNAPIFEKIAVFRAAGIEILEYTDSMEVYFVEDIKPPIGSKRTPGQATGPTILEEYSAKKIVNATQRRNQRSRRGGYQYPSINGRRPRKVKSSPLFAVLENIAVGAPLIKVTAVDDDFEKNAQIYYEIASEEIIGNFNVDSKGRHVMHFNIDRISGELKVNRPLPAESEIVLNITARDIGELSDSITIRFKVLDVNDHAPMFKRPWYSFDLEEGTYYDQTIDRLEAIDDDFGENANVTYQIRSRHPVPFYIMPKTGLLKVNGDLDREVHSEYEFHIVAVDNAPVGKKLSSSVEVEINVLDLNDNAPEFVGFEEMFSMTASNQLDDTGRKMMTDEAYNKLALSDKIPIYKAYLNRDTTPGTFVKQISAIDKDYAGNGNGLVMFSLMHHKQPHLFEIDSREGTVTTISRFNRYNGYEHINLTVVASDLGSPPKSSTAVLLINLQGDSISADDEISLFPHKYYEVEVKENNLYPMALIKINVSVPFIKDQFKWSLETENDIDDIDDFRMDPINGTLILITSLDREVRDMYRFKVRAERIAREGRNLPKMTYPIAGDRVVDLKEDEVRVIIRVVDENDNSPKFKGNGRPIVAVIPNSANFGFPVTRVEATDIDADINSEIHYKLLNEPSRLFGIDEKTGKIRLLGPVNGDQRIFGFDVKATDKRGADDGRSSIANVFVYVLDEDKQVRLVLSGKPIVVEKDIDELMMTLSAAIGLDVRVRLLEPHSGGDQPATDAYIYAVDPKTNTIVSMEDLQSSMALINPETLELHSAQILELSELGKYRGGSSNKSSATMSSTELASIILAVIVFAGSLATSVCVVCIRYKRRRSLPSSEAGLSYSIARVPSSGTGRSKTTTTTSNSPDSKRSLHADISRRPHLFTSVKATKGILTNIDDRPREYIDVPLPKSVLNTNFNLVDHDAACLRFNQLHSSHSNQDTSVPSLQSSGHDSGLGLIARERSETPSESVMRIMRERVNSDKLKCACSRVDINVCCGGDSSDSYEDSLKNSEICHHHQKMQNANNKVIASNHHGFRRSVRNQSRGRPGIRHSFSGVRDDLTQQSPRILVRPRGNSFRNSMTDLERRLQNLDQPYRESFHMNNSRC